MIFVKNDIVCQMSVNPNVIYEIYFLYQIKYFLLMCEITIYVLHSAIETTTKHQDVQSSFQDLYL